MPDKKYFAALVLVLILSSRACAETYYADVKIEIIDNGQVEISGITNHPFLQQGSYSDYTSKEKSVWMLNISPAGTFSEYLIEIRFPRNAILNYLRVPSILSIREESESVIVTSSGSNSEFFAIAQYHIDSSEEPASNYMWLGFIFLAMSAFLFLYWLIFSRKSANGKRIEYNAEALTERQKQIMEIISRNGGSITQSKLQKETGLPKASLSRNLGGLIRKGILSKEQKGMTNLVSVKKKE